MRGLVTSWRAHVKARILERPRSKFGLGRKNPPRTRKTVQKLLPHTFHSESVSDLGTGLFSLLRPINTRQGKSNKHGLFKGKLLMELVRLAIYFNETDYGLRFDDVFQPSPGCVGLIAFVVTIVSIQPHSIVGDLLNSFQGKSLAPTV